MRGVLAECSLGSLVGLIQPGDPPSAVDGRSKDDAPAAKVEAHCMELMLQVCLGTGQATVARPWYVRLFFD